MLSTCSYSSHAYPQNLAMLSFCVRECTGPSSCKRYARVPAAMVRKVRSWGLARGLPAAMVVMRSFSCSLILRISSDLVSSCALSEWSHVTRKLRLRKDVLNQVIAARIAIGASLLCLMRYDFLAPDAKWVKPST